MIDLAQVRGVAQRLREDGYNDYCGDVGADAIDSLVVEIERLRQENELLWKEREEPHKEIALYVSECNRLERELAEENAKLHEMSRLVDFSTQTAENILEKYAEIDAENKRLRPVVEVVADWQCLEDDECGVCLACRARVALKGNV